MLLAGVAFLLLGRPLMAAANLANSPQAIVAQVAQQLGIPVGLADALAQLESGWNPNAVGDQGTSFGLFQLHEGGELGNMSPQSVMGSPQGEYQNALTSLSEVAQVMRANPGMDPGMIAALAQRPANEGAYAASIDRLMGSPSSANASEYAQGAQGGSMLGAPNQAQFMSASTPQIDPGLMQALMGIMGMQGINPYAPQPGQNLPMPGQNAMMPGEQNFQLIDYTTGDPGAAVAGVAQGGPYPVNQAPGIAGVGSPGGPSPTGYGVPSGPLFGNFSPAQAQLAQQSGNPIGYSTFQPWQDVALGAVMPQIIGDQLKQQADVANAGFLTAQTQLGQTEASQGYQNTLAQLGLQQQGAEIQGGALARQGALLPQEKALQEQLFGISGQALTNEQANAQYEAQRSTQNFQGSEAAQGAFYTPGEKLGEQDIQQQLSQTLQSIGLSRQQLGVQESQYGLSYNEQLAQLQDAIKNLGLTLGPGGYLQLARQQAGENLANTQTGLGLSEAAGLYNYGNAGAQAGAAAAGVYNQAMAGVAFPAMAGQIQPYFQPYQGGAYMPGNSGIGSYNPGFMVPNGQGQYGAPPNVPTPPKKP